MQEIKLKTPHLEMAALQWGNPEGIPVLALHGWLDNAHSFVPMADTLSDLNVVALDWPGHGHSQHRHPSARYYVIEFMWDVHLAMNALGWESCHLVGHSLGAAVASVFAAAAPDRVRSLCMIDALGPMANQASETTQQLRRSMTSMRGGTARPLKTYASIEDMIQARLANSDLSREAATLIVERSVQPTAGGYQWSYDPKLYWSSPVYFCEDQILDMFRHMETPTLSLSATPPTVVREEQYQNRLKALRGGKHELIEGGHHFHMEQPEAIAAQLHCFIMEQERGYHSPNNQEA